MKEKWTLLEQYHFIKQLGRLLEKGYGFTTACEFLQMQLNESKQKQLNQGVILLMEGKEVEDMFAYLNFHDDIQTYLQLSKEAGTLSGSLLSASELLKRRIDFQEKCKKILKYPIFLLGFLVCLTFVCNFILFPQFEQLFMTMGASMGTSPVTMLVKCFPFVILLFIILLFCLTWYYKSIIRRKTPYERVVLLSTIPYVKQLMQCYYTYYFANTLSGLLHGGISLHEALQIIGKSQRMKLFQDEMIFISHELLEGNDLLPILQQRKWVRHDLCKVIVHGEANGNLDMELHDYSVHLLNQFERTVHKALTYVQPITFGVIAGMVVLVYLSLLLPLFDMMKNI